MYKIIPLLIIFSDVQGTFWPEVIEQFPNVNATRIMDGASNDNYHLVHDHSDYFLRFAPQAIESIYADFLVECRVLQLMSDLGISPRPLYFDLEKRALVTEFIHHTQERIDLLDPTTRSHIFEMLHRIEKSEATISRTFQPFSDVMKLVEKANVINYPLSEEFTLKVLPALEQIDHHLSKNPYKSLCHLDLHSKNILKDGNRYWIVDWEYAAMSHPYLVLASMASIERWSDQQMNALLNDYKASPTLEDTHRLYLYRIVADIFWTSWNHVQMHSSPLDIPYLTWKELFQEAALQRIDSEKFQEAIKFFSNGS